MITQNVRRIVDEWIDAMLYDNYGLYMALECECDEDELRKLEGAEFESFVRAELARVSLAELVRKLKGH